MDRVSLGERLDEYKGIGPGFDHLRVGLATSILAWHSYGAVYGPAVISGVPAIFKAVLATLLPLFFGLSGFLIMGSAFRTHNVRTFITFRALRILPALIVEISLSALVLGPIVTTASLGEYFSDPQFYSYFGSLIGAIKFFLPGVFIHNPLKTVNGALWTVGPEIVCYCLVAAMMLTGLFTKKGPMIFCTVLYLAVCLFADQWETKYNLFHLPTKALILSFLSANLLYLYRNDIRYDRTIFLGIFVLATATILAAQSYSQIRILFYIPAIILPYCAAYIGLTQFRPLPFFSHGDYSYGIYIYAFPIQQAVVYFFPAAKSGWFNFGIAFPVTTAFAVMSWHLIEKPVLGLRKRMLPDPGVLAKDETREGFTRRKLVLLGVIAIYGVFVTNASQVFPMKSIYYALVGKTTEKGDNKLEQF